MSLVAASTVPGQHSPLLQLLVEDPQTNPNETAFQTSIVDSSNSKSRLGGSSASEPATTQIVTPREPVTQTADAAAPAVPAPAVHDPLAVSANAPATSTSSGEGRAAGPKPNDAAAPSSTAKPSKAAAPATTITAAPSSDGAGGDRAMQPLDDADAEEETVAAVAALNEQRKLTRRLGDNIDWLRLTSQQMDEMLREEGTYRHNEYFDLRHFEETANAVWRDRELSDMSPDSKSTVKLFQGSNGRAGGSPARLSPQRVSVKATPGQSHLAVVNTSAALAVSPVAKRDVDQSSLHLSDIAETGSRHPLLLRQRSRNEERRDVFRRALEQKAAERSLSQSQGPLAIAASGAKTLAIEETPSTSQELPTKRAAQLPAIVEKSTSLASTPGAALSAKALKHTAPLAIPGGTTYAWRVLAEPAQASSEAAVPADHVENASESPAAPSTPQKSVMQRPASSSSAATAPKERKATASGGATDYVKLLREQQELLSRAAHNDEHVYRPMLQGYFRYTRESQKRLEAVVDEALIKLDARQRQAAAEGGVAS